MARRWQTVALHTAVGCVTLAMAVVAPSTAWATVLVPRIGTPGAALSVMAGPTPSPVPGSARVRSAANLVAARRAALARADSRVATVTRALTALETRAETLTERYDRAMRDQQQAEAEYDMAAARLAAARRTQETDARRFGAQGAADAGDGVPEHPAQPGGPQPGGPHSDGSHADGTQDDESQADEAHGGGSQRNGTQSRGTKANGTKANGTQANGTQADGTQADGTQSRGTQADGTQADGTQSRGTQADGTQSGGSQPGGLQDDGMRDDGTQNDGTQRSHGPQDSGTQGRGSQADGTQGGGAQGDGPGHDWPPSDVATATQSTTAVNWAITQIGKPYQWGGAGPDSYDCSGLAMDAWARAGIHLAHWTGYQWLSGPHVSLTDLRPGDLVFYATNTADPATIHHVGIYTGQGMMVDAPFTGADVRFDSIHQFAGLIGATRPAA